jgi:DNA-binding CsgD family transcriptional regulator
MASMRAELVRDRLDALGRAGLDFDTYTRSAIDLLRQAVPVDAGCMASVDPATGMITKSIKFDITGGTDHDFAHFEYEIADLNQFAEIARRPAPIGVLDHDTGGDLNRSIRYREFIKPKLGMHHEMRSALISGGAGWGGITLLRSSDSSGFSPAEADFVHRVSPTIATGIRTSLVNTIVDTPHDAAGPAVVIIGTDNSILQSTPAAENWIDELGREGDRVTMPLAAVVSGARALRAGLGTNAPTARLRSRSGQWLVVHAAPLDRPTAGSGDVVLTIEEARPPEILPLIVAAYGLTEREQSVVHMVLTGSETNEIAKTLHLSPYTVQDHLKSIFAKAGVNSRRELTARVFFDQYAPRLGQPVGPSGWFTS